jgi:hypothetical protein
LQKQKRQVAPCRKVTVTTTTSRCQPQQQYNIQSRPLRVLFNDETDRPIAPGFPLLITNTISTGVGTCAIITTDVGEPALEWTRPLEDLDFKGITTCLYTVCDANTCAKDILVTLKIQEVQAWNDPNPDTGAIIEVGFGLATRSYNVLANDEPSESVLRLTAVEVIRGPGTCTIQSRTNVLFSRAPNTAPLVPTTCSYQACTLDPTVIPPICDSAEVTFTPVVPSSRPISSPSASSDSSEDEDSEDEDSEDEDSEDEDSEDED